MGPMMPRQRMHTCKYYQLLTENVRKEPKSAELRFHSEDPIMRV